MNNYILTYSSRSSSAKLHFSLTTNDEVIIAQFRTWRFGQYTRPVDDNVILKEDSWISYKRSYRQIWIKAEECLAKTESIEAKRYFRNIAKKFKNLTIYK